MGSRFVVTQHAFQPYLLRTSTELLPNEFQASCLHPPFPLRKNVMSLRMSTITVKQVSLPLARASAALNQNFLTFVLSETTEDAVVVYSDKFGDVHYSSVNDLTQESLLLGHCSTIMQIVCYTFVHSLLSHILFVSFSSSLSTCEKLVLSLFTPFCWLLFRRFLQTENSSFLATETKRSESAIFPRLSIFNHFATVTQGTRPKKPQ